MTPETAAIALMPARTRAMIRVSLSAAVDFERLDQGQTAGSAPRNESNVAGVWDREIPPPEAP